MFSEIVGAVLLFIGLFLIPFVLMIAAKRFELFGKTDDLAIVVAIFFVLFVVTQFRIDRAFRKIKEVQSQMAIGPK